VRYASTSKDAAPWITIAGVIEDFPSTIRSPNGSSMGGARIYHLTMPGERSDALLTLRLNGRAPETFMPTLRGIATSVDPTLQFSKMSALDARYRDYAKGGAQLALVVLIVTGVVILLSAAGIHALMSFAVNQRRREIGIRAALGAPASRILQGVLARATRQLVLGVGIGVGVAITIDRASGGSLTTGAGLLFVPTTVVLMLIVGLIAAAGPARRGLQVQPTEALRSE
jgi:ABC-type antimicrobial peptide transport system permease subunit